MLQSNFYRIFCGYLKEKHLKKPKISNPALLNLYIGNIGQNVFTAVLTGLQPAPRFKWLIAQWRALETAKPFQRKLAASAGLRQRFGFARVERGVRSTIIHLNYSLVAQW